MFLIIMLILEKLQLKLKCEPKIIFMIAKDFQR